MGIDYKQGKAVGVWTTSRIEKFYKVNLGLVQLGEIKLHKVSAMVLDGLEPVRELLGMSFLGQLDMQKIGERMDFKQKF